MISTERMNYSRSLAEQMKIFWVAEFCFCKGTSNQSRSAKGRINHKQLLGGSITVPGKKERSKVK